MRRIKYAHGFGLKGTCSMVDTEDLRKLLAVARASDKVDITGGGYLDLRIALGKLNAKVKP